MTWPGSVDGQPILTSVWSRSRPCVFVLLDTASRVHVWDLGAGDIYPAHTVQFEDNVIAVDINPEVGSLGQRMPHAKREKVIARIT